MFNCLHICLILNKSQCHFILLFVSLFDWMQLLYPRNVRSSTCYAAPQKKKIYVYLRIVVIWTNWFDDNSFCIFLNHNIVETSDVEAVHNSQSQYLKSQKVALCAVILFEYWIMCIFIYHNNTNRLTTNQYCVAWWWTYTVHLNRN